MSDDTTVLETVGDLRVRLVYQDDTEDSNPREDDGNTGVMALFHRRYTLGDQGDHERTIVQDAMDRYGSWALTARYLRAFHGATVVLPVGLIDHSGISVYAGTPLDVVRDLRHPFDSQGWDSGTVGIIFDTPATREGWGERATPERVEAALREEVEIYGAYLRGEVYGYIVERHVDESASDYDEMLTWEEVESCYGYVGHENAVDAAQGALASFVTEEQS